MTERMSTDDAVRLADVFKLLSDPTRTRILDALAEGELCVGDVAAAVDVGETVASQALRLLRTAGIVRNRRVGRLVYYRLDDEHVRLLLEICRAHLGMGAREPRPRLAQVGESAYLRATPGSKP